MPSRSPYVNGGNSGPFYVCFPPLAGTEENLLSCRLRGIKGWSKMSERCNGDNNRRRWFCRQSDRESDVREMPTLKSAYTVPPPNASGADKRDASRSQSSDRPQFGQNGGKKST